IYGMKASVSLLMEVGIENIFYHITALIDLLAQGLNEQGWIIRSDLTSTHRSGIISFQSRNEQSIPTKNVFEKLMQSGITVSYRDGAIRVSPHFYNTENEIRQILEKLNAWV
ncbi:MAG TPA: aminotransferase class V-fold PLP-dependent enzyme, partial [bacterium]|nr:aminotransferase class V-fold PLP-dependent enzyme [bacterium]